MKKFIAIILAVLFTGAITSCKKQDILPQTASLHSFGSTAKRDLATAD